MERVPLETKLRRECAAMRVSRNQWRSAYITLAMSLLTEQSRALIPADYDDDQRAAYILENFDVLMRSDV